MSDNKTTSGGIGFTSLLLIAFIVLKLCDVIDWSWWWVLSPFWIPIGVCLIILSVLGIVKRQEAKDNKKIVTKNGEFKSRWEQRLEEMQAAKARAEELKAQRNA